VVSQSAESFRFEKKKKSLLEILLLIKGAL
jgi:hypothetical protein